VDLITLAIEVLFGALFLASLVNWVRRRDELSRDVMLVFAAMAMLFALAALQSFVGELPPAVTGIGLAMLLAQPILTLRLVHRIRPLRGWLFRSALVAYLVTALPLLVLPLDEGGALLILPALAVFVLTDLLAAYHLAAEARRRMGSARMRLFAAASASALLAVAMLAATVGSRLPLPEQVADNLGRFIGLSSAVLYVVAFLPPRWLRQLWNAVATFEFTQHLTGDGTDAEDGAIWNRLANVAARLTGSRATLVVTGVDDGGWVAAVGGEEDARDMLFGARLAAVPRPGEMRWSLADQDEDLRRLAGMVDARVAWVLPFPASSGRPGALVLLRRRPSLFASDDHEMLESIVAVADVFAQRASALAEQAALAQRLSVTIQALEQASQAKSDFLASMSHELRTPLSAIIGFSALMKEEPLAADRRQVPDEWVEHVHRSGQHLLALINDVLDLTKIEAGRLDLELEPFDLSTALTESVEGLRPLAARKSLRVALQVEPGQVLADRGRLRQIVYNLLSNAIKFTPEGGSVSVEARWDGRDALIAVADTGVGIASEDVSRIFEEFSQVGDLKAREAGTGLGLALSRRLAEAHNGVIRVTSEPGVGSRFEVVLPDARADAPATEREPSVPVATPRGACVLVIEDDPGAIRLLRTYLEAEGYAVEVTTDGDAGLAAARALVPDAIILDVLLPGIDGWEVLRRLKADPAVADVPVVVVTVVDERNVAMSLGAVDYFLKPVQPAALLARLGRYTFTTKVRQRRVSVLAIDDDPAARDLVASSLRSEGFEVVVAASGQEGLERAFADPPELVICDLLMPDMDGYEVVRRLGSNESTRDVTILILTAHELSAADRDRLNGKVADVLHKGEELPAALAVWLRRASQASRRADAAVPAPQF
jgi:signal transduction histidine kinase/CheY-like chemotaxis protein